MKGMTVAVEEHDGNLNHPIPDRVEACGLNVKHGVLQRQAETPLRVPAQRQRTTPAQEAQQLPPWSSPVPS